MLNKRVITIWLVVLSLFGQFYSYASMPCTMMSESDMSDLPMSMADMDHSQMDHSTIDHSTMDHSQMQSQPSTMDCCDADHACPMSGCLTHVMFLPDTFQQAVAAHQSVLLILQINPVEPTISGLYRPPIAS